MTLSQRVFTSASGRDLFLYRDSTCLSRIEISNKLIFSVMNVLFKNYLLIFLQKTNICLKISEKWEIANDDIVPHFFPPIPALEPISNVPNVVIISLTGLPMKQFLSQNPLNYIIFSLKSSISIWIFVW